MTHKPPIAIEQENLDSGGGAFKDSRRSGPGAARDPITQANAVPLGMRESLCGRIRREDSLTQGPRASGLVGQTRERREIDRAAFGMQIEQALRELRHLGDAARNGDPRQRMSAQIFQHGTDEVSHVDQRGVRQCMKLFDRPLGRR